MGTDIRLVAGLGNPGPQYATTRHNAGFWFADLLARQFGGTFRPEKRFAGETCELEIRGHMLRLLKPATFMNESGRAVGAMLRYYRTPPEALLVAYDELDLEPGRAKLKLGGSGAGHNGIASIVAAVGSGFWRLRLGIGHPGPGRHDAVLEHVLSRAGADDEQRILDAIGTAIEALEVLLEAGPERAQNTLHRRRAGDTADDDPTES